MLLYISDRQNETEYVLYILQTRSNPFKPQSNTTCHVKLNCTYTVFTRHSWRHVVVARCLFGIMSDLLNVTNSLASTLITTFEPPNCRSWFYLMYTRHHHYMIIIVTLPESLSLLLLSSVNLVCLFDWFLRSQFFLNKQVFDQTSEFN